MTSPKHVYILYGIYIKVCRSLTFSAIFPLHVSVPVKDRCIVSYRQIQILITLVMEMKGSEKKML